MIAAATLVWMAAPASAAPTHSIQSPASIPLIRVAQTDRHAGSQPTRSVEDARRQLATDQALRSRLHAEQASLVALYRKQLNAVDRLKKRRASWRRDRQIRSQMSKSHRTAEQLSRLSQQVRQLDARIRSDRKALVRLIDSELASSPSTARRNRLLTWRQAAQRGLRKHAKKIVLPDETIDPLADPEELEYQASLLSQSESQLARELELLDKQARRYSHMASLRQKYARADEFDRFDNDSPRRAPGGGNRNADAAEDPQPANVPPPASDGAGAENDDGLFNEGIDPVGAGGDAPAFDVVLSEVVDASTVRALRDAGLSSDPAVKAKAAERARTQVQKRLEQLKKRRQLMQKRASKLRNQR